MRSRILLFLALTGAAPGEENDLPELEIIGSAERSPELPGTALDEEWLRSLPAGPSADYQEILALVPGGYSGNPVAGSFSLRGISQDSIFSHLNTGSNPLIAVMENGAALSPNTLRYLPPLRWGLERAVVLRGPQSHLPGPNAIGGALLLDRAAPSSNSGGRAMTEVAEGGTLRVGFHQDAVLIPGELSFSASLFHQESDGFETNLWSDDSDFGATTRDRFDGRLRWIPRAHPEARVDLSLVHDRSRGNPVALSTEFPGRPLHDRVTEVNTRPSYPAERWATTLHASIPLSEQVSMESITAIQRFDGGDRRDLDGRATVNWIADGFSDELRFSQYLGASGERETIRWKGGAYYEDSDYEIGYRGQGGYPLPSGVPYDNAASDRVRIAALHGEIDWEFHPRWFLAAGLRLNHEDRHLSATSVFGPQPPAENSDTLSESEWLPQLTVRWAPDEETAAGLKISRAYRSAGLAHAATLAAVQPYAAERGWETELFARIRPVDSLQLSAAIFHARIRDMQVPVAVPGGFPGIDTLITNAARSERFGAELESHWKATDELTMFGSLGWTHTRFDELSIGGMNRDGQAFPNSPEWTAAFGIDYHHPAGAFGSLLFSYASSSYSTVDKADSTRLETRKMLGAKVGYRWEGAEVYVFGSNLLDDDYALLRLDNTASGGTVSGKVAAPRLFGIGCEFWW